MFQKCKHIRKIEDLATPKTTLKEHVLLSGNILKEFYCVKCDKLVASIIINPKRLRTCKN